MNKKTIITICGKVENQLPICKMVAQSLSGVEIIFSFSNSDQLNREKLIKYMVRPKLWERVIPDFHNLYRVEKEKLGGFLSLLSPFPNSIAIIAGNECIYRSLSDEDICFFPTSKDQSDEFIAQLNNLEASNTIVGFSVDEDDYEDPYFI